MIDVLIGALRLSLDKCNTISNPNEYGYEVNQVLNRFKTNLFKLIPDKAKHLYDPKEFIQIRLTFHWKTWMGKPGEVSVKEHSPVLLHVNGFIPELGLRANRERTFIRTVDVSDIVNIDKIANIVPDVPLEVIRTNTIASSIVKRTLRSQHTCVYHESLGAFEGVRTWGMQIAAMVYPSEDIDPRSFNQVIEDNKVRVLKTSHGSNGGKMSAELRLTKIKTAAQKSPTQLFI